MVNRTKLSVIAAAAFVIGLGFNSFALSGVPANYSVAVVDVSKVVAQSSEVKDLKKEQEARMQSLEKWLETVRADIAKQSTDENKQKLIKKYDNDFVKKQEAIRKDYSQKLQTIDDNISAAIAKESKAKKYNVVLAKGIVLYGGEDITATISKAVK